MPKGHHEVETPLICLTNYIKTPHCACLCDFHKSFLMQKRKMARTGDVLMQLSQNCCTHIHGAYGELHSHCFRTVFNSCLAHIVFQSRFDFAFLKVTWSCGKTVLHHYVLCILGVLKLLAVGVWAGWWLVGDGVFGICRFP